MAMIKFQSKPRTGQSSLADIPQDVKDDVDEAYGYLTDHADQEGFAEFETEAERKRWIADVRGYCASREAGVLTFRILPSKNLPVTQVRFGLTANLPGNAAQNNSGRTEG
jgi:hypothetical protein